VMREYPWRTGPRSEAGKEDDEATAFSFSRLRGDAASVGLRDTLDDRQAQVGAAPITVRLSVGVEDGRQCLVRNAYSRIPTCSFVYRSSQAMMTRTRCFISSPGWVSPPCAL
jgi:hypothetical protein